MTWQEIGWVIIALAAILILVFSLLFKTRTQYRVRTPSSMQAFFDQRVRAVERGERCLVVLGDQFWSRAYPGLGLHALAFINSLKRVDLAANEDQVIAAGAGELALFARHIVQGSYQSGFSPGLSVSLPGPTPFSFLAGLMPEIRMHATGSLGLFGIYGTGGALLSEAAQIIGTHPFAAAGSLTAQAALYLNTLDLLLGEEVFMLPGLIDSTPLHQAGWLSEDILRGIVCVLLVVAAILKLAGVL